MEPVNFRSASNADIPAIQELVFSVLKEYELEPDPETTDADLADIQASYFDNGGRFDVLVNDGGDIVGTVGLFSLSSDICELRKMYLHPAHRGRGHGKRILDFSIQNALNMGFKRVILETASVLKEAIVLYERFGFRPLEAHNLADRCDQAYFLDL